MIAVNNRAATWPRAIVEMVLVDGRIFISPERFAGASVHAGEACVFAVAVEVIKLALGDGGHAVAWADFLVPKDFRATLGPDDALLGGDAIAGGAKKLGPIAALGNGDGCKEGKKKGNIDLSHWYPHKRLNHRGTETQREMQG